MANSTVLPTGVAVDTGTSFVTLPPITLVSEGPIEQPESSTDTATDDACSNDDDAPTDLVSMSLRIIVFVLFMIPFTNNFYLSHTRRYYATEMVSSPSEPSRNLERTRRRYICVLFLSAAPVG